MIARRVTAALLGAFTVAALLPAAAAAQSQTAGPPPADATAGERPAALVATEGEGTGLWVVELAEPSLATYTGDATGLAPTSPQVTGAPRLDVDAPASRAYLAHLEDRQDDLRAGIDDALGREVEVAFEYRTVVNGLAVRIDDDEAERLTELPGVAAVYRDVEREPLTDVSHELINTPSVWDGATGSDAGTRGEGVLVGVIDSGINPGHPSFAATGGDGYAPANPFGTGNYVGVCAPEHPDHEDICNDKLVGAWNFHPSAPDARDDDGHGSHTASTAAGNVHEATATIGNGTFTRTVQGVAPHANVISYLVCSPSCPGTSSVAAVEQAIADGVDVLNYSISGSDDPWNDIVDLAFLEAFNAGVFVAASAGNDGPGESTVAHTGPWNAAVAATTTYRAFANTVDVVGPAPVPDGLTGLPAVPGSGPAPAADLEAELRDAAVVAPGNAAGCASFAAGTFDGALALVDRGDCDFSVKVTNAAAAGAVAVLVANNVAGPPTAMGALEDTTIPALMVEQRSAAALRAAGTVLTARVNAATTLIENHDWQDLVAGFSSRGPSRLDLLAPSFAAPGVDILAAGAERDGDADQYMVNSGTSMASPHVAGAGALLTALHPEWSPAEIRSALAATADTAILKENGATPADPLDVGSGRIDLDAAGRAGLVMDESYEDFRAADPAAGGDPATLNLPAFVDGTCVGTCSWTRTVRNVADVAATYTASTTAPDGFAVTVEPAEFALAPGATQQVEVTVTADLAAVPLGRPSFADVRFTTDATHANGRAVAPSHYPVVVTPREEVPPSLSVTPGSIAATQRPDETATHTLTLGNGGNTDLRWEVYADEELRRPRGPVTPVETAPATAGGGLTTSGPAATTAAAVVPEREPDDAVTQTLTHSASQAIVAGNAIACSADDGATTSANSYLRTFTLADFGVDDAFDVTQVEFGVESLTVAQDLTVALYTLTDPAAPLTRANLTPVGSATQTLQPQRQTLATVPVTGTIPAGATLVAEVSAPDLSGVGGFWPGSNRAGQSAPTYLTAPGCDLAEPADLATLGFPYVHLVLNVVGTTEAPACTAPGELPWLGVAPAAGTVAPDATGRIELTVDTAGLAPDQLSGLLCLRTNDPRNTLTTVPLAVTVVGDSGLTGDAEQTRLTADGGPDDRLGNAVAIDGDTAVVGAAQATVDGFGASGAAYVYTRSGDGWERTATLLPDGERDWGLVFGRSVAVDGDTIVVGATGARLGDSRPGAAYVFVRDGDGWTQQARLSTADVRWGAELGYSVAVDGDTVAAGAPGEHVGENNAAGVVYVFDRDGDTWSAGHRLAGSDVTTFGNFGSSVALDGATLVAGAPNTSARGVFRQGAAYVFTGDADGWTQRATLLPSDAAPELAFGTSVDVDRGTAVVGAGGPNLDSVSSDGAVYVYEGHDDAWSEQAKLTSTGAHVNDRFGWSVGVDGDTVVAGAPYRGHTAGVDLDKGAAVVFVRDGRGWTQQRTLLASDTAQGDHLGTAVAVSGDDVLVGAPNAHVGDVADQGAAYVFVPGADAPAPPSITVEPGELAADVAPGDAAQLELSIGNAGGRDLNWAIDTTSTLSGPLRPAGTGTVVESGPAVAAPADADGAWTTAAPDPAPDAATQDAEAPAVDAVRLTHSASMDVVETAVPVCSSTQTGTTRANRFLRTFTLTDFGIDGAFDVSEVSFGLQLVTPSADLTVNLYTLDGPFEYVNLTRLASETISVEDAAATVLSVPVSAQVPAGATLVLEVSAPDLLGVGAVVPGANTAGQTGPSYISADDCGAPDPVTMESLGFPDAHLVMAVDGTPREPVSCALPDWLAVDPASGTVAPGEQATAMVTLDSAGLTAGEHATHLCVAGDDPAAPVTAVPVRLTVGEAGEPDLSVETSDQRGIWYGRLTWTGVDADRVDVERDGLVVATVANTGTHVDQIGRPRKGESFTYRVCAAGTETCSAPVTVFPRGEIRGPDRS
ncbi:S8 family serine peptidase [Jiangella sp. DSM 45060]|uniref:S8 family serine peptidase n=1 Tax=Jiangella sp. DSM 45060 TaxID=1798224 RepID=UPI000879ADDE|nr:S8 family serine peptidase [Jiangella sp. DSM 45060]SDS20549.1 Peptidase inhibitor I9 [Jiangella sp. DSM 45060]